MGVFNLKVEVGAIYPPKPIRVFIDNLGNDIDNYEFVSPKSFDQNFDIPSGKYIITISGMNQENDETKISVGGNFTPNKTRKTNSNNYSIVFIGEII